MTVLSRTWPWLSAALVMAATVGGCEDETSPPVVTPPTSAGNGGSNEGGDVGVGGGMGGDDRPMGGGDAATVHLGITTNPLTVDGEPPSASDTIFAELTAYAAGVSTIVLEVPFDDLDAAQLDQIEQRVAAYAERELEVVLELLVVDGTRSHRPEATANEAWDAPATVASLRVMLTDLLDRTGEHVAVVVLSRRADRYLALHPKESDALTSLHASAIAEVMGRGGERLTGVGVSFDPDSRQMDQLVALGNAVVFSYLPGLGDDAFPSDAAPALALDAMVALATTDGDDEARPVVIQALGYPSSPIVSSSAEVQRQQLDAFFAALEPRRAAFPFVNVQQLHDLDATACDALLTAMGRTTGDPWGAYMCTTGLRDVDGMKKEGWDRFLQAAAALRGD